MKRNFLFKISIFFFTITFFLNSCTKENTLSSLARQELFKLSYGSYEDEIRLFNLNKTGDIDTSLVMQDGFFYIANDESKKIMQLTSYGDLVGVIYNKDTNPVPSFVDASAFETIPSGVNLVEKETSTQMAVEYSFNDLGKIAVDRNKKVYAVDVLPQERFEVDGTNGVILREVVLRINADGTFDDYLGQQGAGGTPFPYIKNLYTTKNNELVIISMVTNGYIVYWYSETGMLLYTIPISLDAVPKIATDETTELFVSLHKIVPSYDQQLLYLKVDYHVSEIDASSKVQSGIAFERSLLYPLDIQTGMYGEPLVIPAYEEVVTDGYSKNTYLISYEFMGVTQSGWFFFTIADEKGYSIMVVQPNGQKILRRHLDVNHEEVLYQNFNLSYNGIISALLANEKEVEVVWWRTDSVIDNLIQ